MENAATPVDDLLVAASEVLSAAEVLMEAITRLMEITVRLHLAARGGHE